MPVCPDIYKGKIRQVETRQCYTRMLRQFYFLICRKEFQIQVGSSMSQRTCTVLKINLNYTMASPLGCVHMRTNHVPKDVSNCDLKRDWDCDFNYVRSHALHANAFPITIRVCALRGNILFPLRSLRWLTHAWLQHGFSAHFQNAHAQITFRKSFAFTCPRIKLSTWITIQNALFSRFKTRFKSLIWNSFAFTKAKIRLSNQERAESRSEMSFGTWFILRWTGPLFTSICTFKGCNAFVNYIYDIPL